MATPARKAAPVPAAPAGFNFGDLSAYSAGGGVPEGDYAWKSLDVVMHQHEKQSGEKVGKAFLAVAITMAPLAGGEDRIQYYGLGSNAHQSWAPNAETGKGIVPIPGGPGTPPNASTNWAMLVKSLFDSGLPNGTLGDDLSVLEGTWVHMINIPEPEERKGFRAKTGEAAVEEKARTIPVVSEIKDDGKPWEGSGGVPKVEAPAPVKAATGPAKAAPPKTKAVPTVQNDGIEAAAISAVSAVLEKSPNGILKLQLRTATFKAVTEAEGADMTQSVMSAYFGSDDSLNGLLGQLGYGISGPHVKALQ